MMQTYSGSCHCGKIKFEVDADLDHVRACDCSVCSKRGALIHRVDDAHLRIHTPLDELALYQWNTRTASDYFCPHCGILPFRRPRAVTSAEVASGLAPFDGWGINVCCLDDVDLESIPVVRVHGSQLS